MAGSWCPMCSFYCTVGTLIAFMLWSQWEEKKKKSKKELILPQLLGRRAIISVHTPTNALLGYSSGVACNETPQLCSALPEMGMKCSLLLFCLKQGQQDFGLHYLSGQHPNYLSRCSAAGQRIPPKKPVVLLQICIWVFPCLQLLCVGV